MTAFGAGFIIGLICPLLMGLAFGLRSEFLARRDSHDEITIAIARRVGEMQGNGYPWQRRDLSLMRAALDALSARART